MRFIKPGRMDGVCRAPSSKSEFQRAIAVASLARGQSEISFCSLCDDSKSALGIVEALGASVLPQDDRVIIRGGRLKPAGLLDCGESGLCLRMFAPIAALFDREITLTGKGSLLKRPVSMVEKALENAGVRCRSRGGLPPLTVRGPLAGGSVNLDGSLSSQHVTGFLIALPLVAADSELVVDNPRSLPYLKLTLAVMEAFGVGTKADFAAGRFFVPGGQVYRPRPYRVEGDWSAAAFLLVAGAVAGRVTVRGLNLESPQADKGVVRVLTNCGAKVSSSPGAVTASLGSLSAFDFDAADAPDLVPPLSVLACFCRGTSRIRGIGRLRHKESDRVEALLDVLGRMKGRLRVSGDCLEITGSKLRGARVSSHHDHRIAMAAAIAGLGSRDGVEISRPGCVAKSYPRFFEDLERLKTQEDTP
jgi:3-phosphoshikimate 1-carboxyvinyltransferase